MRRHVATARGQLAGLVAVNLLGHLVLNSWNSYGVHPFYPLDMRWYYGDAIFIVPSPSHHCWRVANRAGAPCSHSARRRCLWQGCSWRVTWHMSGRLPPCRPLGAGLASGCRNAGSDAVTWNASVRQPLARLRELARNNCRVRAWLQFGRAPALDDRAIGDLRYGGATRENFTTMPLRSPKPDSCPPNLTHWAMPRRDLIDVP